jgi:uncharacterized DUF497 family protein
VHSFEWDEKKNEVNIGKHGISFETAKNLWTDPRGSKIRIISVRKARLNERKLYEEK